MNIAAERSIEEIIRLRHSSRSYSGVRLAENDRLELDRFISEKITGPFGSAAEFKLIAAESSDSSELKGLGTYGFIKNPAAFVVGIVKESEKNPEDFGYAMEKIILHATDMGLGTCWLGGSFKRSSFALKAGIAGDEIIPAVASAGYIADKINGSDMLIRASSGSVRRKKHDEIFFSGSMGAMEINFNEGYGRALEMVRLAPSASNRQPWRIVKEDDKDVFHFYLERSPIYKRIIKLLKYEDLQRIDMGIAMCHFECTVTELGLRGLWQTGNNPDVKVPEGWIYTITWEGE